ncbi:MlaD family protein [Algivirga pacifica]|uniref:MlaD family protein n=1 Tax=Algivirga pacifica TaxID=1162670 RepID=A0ABP9DGH9_9BACT
MTKEIKVGVFTLIAGAILYIGFNFLKGVDVFSSENTYYVVYDNAAGLLESNTVQLNGFQVGTVRDIKILQDKGNKIGVEIAIDKALRLPKNTVAKLSDNGLLGEKMVDLDIPQSKGNVTYLEGGDYIKGEIEENILSSIQKKADPLIGSLKVTMDSVQQMMEIYAQVGLEAQKTLVTTQQLMAANQYKINQTVSGLHLLVDNLNKDIPALMNNINSITDTVKSAQLSETIASTNETLKSLQSTLKAVNEGEGTLGKLMKEEALHDEMLTTMKDLDALLIDFREYPKRYVHFSIFGKKHIPYKGEETAQETENVKSTK